MLQRKIQNLVQQFSPIATANEFYFQKGRDAVTEWLQLYLSAKLKPRIIELSTRYDDFIKEAESDEEVRAVLNLLLTIVSYCDIKARDKHLHNKYPDKRSLAEASVRMNNWIEKIVLFKYERDSLAAGSVKNALSYLIYPKQNTTILSENHRKLISTNLFKQEFDSTTFVEQLKEYFSPYQIKVKNENNYTHLLSRIIYNIKEEWQEEVVGLMASDGTGWQDDFLNRLQNYKSGIVWNTKRPSGTTKTLAQLRELLDSNQTFPLYYSAGGTVNYLATVIDFAENQNDLHRIRSMHPDSILDWQDTFDDYYNENKQAKIVFLVETMSQIKPIATSEFEFYKGYDSPRQDNISPLKSYPDTKEEVKKVQDFKNTESMQLLNQILFGPPGTGKTYNSINHAVAILESKSTETIAAEPRRQVKKRFDEYQKSGRIVFTTFHQSMSYEDFIEGIKPQILDNHVVYQIEHGLFKRISIDAAFSITQLTDSKEAKKVLTFYQLYDQMVASIEETLSNENASAFFPTKSGGQIQIEGISDQGNILVRHIDGTRSYVVSKERLGKLDQAIANLDEVSNIDSEFRQIIGGSNSSAYWAVLRAIRTLKPQETVPLKAEYSVEDKLAAIQTLRQVDFQRTDLIPYVIIIDEINRGNISQVFGELITLIESDKRLGRDEAIEITLPYSKDKYGVPPNLFIVGTMNTADRSVEALDTALRRRFSFFEKPAKPDLIRAEGDSKGTIDSIDLVKMLITINERIEKLIDKDHKIGHAYFMDCKTMGDLVGVFHNKVIPLLQEYFFGDFGKIGLVLGDTFVEVENDKQFGFAAFKGYSDDSIKQDLASRPVYKIKDRSQWNFASIYESNN